MNNLIFNVPLITGKTNSTIVKIGKLQNKKYRNEEKLFICDGIKLFREADKFNANIKYIVIDNNAELSDEICQIVKKYKENNTNVLCVETDAFKKLTTENAPQGIITVCEATFPRNAVKAHLFTHETVGGIIDDGGYL